MVRHLRTSDIGILYSIDTRMQILIYCILHNYNKQNSIVLANVSRFENTFQVHILIDIMYI